MYAFQMEFPEGNRMAQWSRISEEEQVALSPGALAPVKSLSLGGPVFVHL